MASKTALGRKQVEHTETPIQHEWDDIRWAEIMGLTRRKPKRTFEEMLNTVGEYLSDLIISDDSEDLGDKDDNKDDSELGKLSDDN